MDLQTFIIRVKQLASHPVIKLFVMPLSLLFYGIVFGAKIDGINFLGTFILYLFMVVMQFIEQYLFVNDMKKGYIKWEPLYFFDAIIIGLLCLLLMVTNLIFVILALFYVISVHLIYALFQLKGTIYFLIIQVCLKAVVATILASFMQLNVITPDLLLATISICGMVLFYYAEMERLDTVKYGLAVLNKGTLTLLSFTGLAIAFISPILLQKLALTNIFFLVLWIALALLMVQFMGNKKRYIQTARSKNYLSTLFTLFVLLFSLL
ncbi:MULTISPECIES: hypothetical protein [unclassified Granulicatella]|uniref:hypothetical protein n=1 Tax=unclassified Granulicatella TaxID=2630493 RepID=UPI0010731C70|nr:MULTISPECIES: hypothetical protein [unclassified Granulicatella]MBF0779990.1 hypothetical protein [Granulicatella sp. 19428wC4_WM01]TFU95916.1 hypothetical protein E4T68_02660 [Granulicatella sp. WM01]